MSWALMMKLLHVLTAFWMFAGMVGRGLTYWQAGKEKDHQAVISLLKASDTFERRMVIPGSMSVLVFGLITAWLEGLPVLGFLQGGSSNWLLVSLFLFLISIPVIIFYLLPRRRQREKAVAAALAKGELTPDLSAAARDEGVMAFRTAEILIVVVIIILMVMKPF